MSITPEYMGGLVDATIAQIHELSTRLNELAKKDNQLRSARGDGKFSEVTLAKIDYLLKVPLENQIRDPSAQQAKDGA